MLPALEDYEQLVYSLPDRSDAVVHSTLVLVRHGAGLATVRGEVTLADGAVLRVAEMINFAAGCIEAYSYEVIRSGEKVTWFDPQPHPDDPSLASSFPHHQHVPPNIKGNRVPATQLSFDRPNLPTLVDLLTREQAAPCPAPMKGDTR